MSDPARIHVATGDAMARISLADGRAADVELSLRGSGAKCVAVDPREPRRIYAGTFDDGVYVSDDGGESWRESSSGLDDRRVLALAVSRSHQQHGTSIVYAGTEPSNLYRSEDAGESWQRLPALRELPRYASCRASPAGRFRDGPGPITCGRSPCTRRIPTGSS